jgi:hypothetical protein
MARTYTEIKRIIQPLYQRYRNTFRGPRSSHLENLEMNKILIDIKRLDQKTDILNEKIYEDVRVFVGQVDPETYGIHEEREDGLYYTFNDVEIFPYGESPTPNYIEIPTTITMSSKMSRLAHKVNMLESKGNN